jgi:hypothetical protein
MPLTDALWKTRPLSHRTKRCRRGGQRPSSPASPGRAAISWSSRRRTTLARPPPGAVAASFSAVRDGRPREHGAKVVRALVHAGRRQLSPAQAALVGRLACARSTAMACDGEARSQAHRRSGRDRGAAGHRAVLTGGLNPQRRGEASHAAQARRTAARHAVVRGNDGGDRVRGPAAGTPRSDAEHRVALLVVRAMPRARRARCGRPARRAGSSRPVASRPSRALPRRTSAKSAAARAELTQPWRRGRGRLRVAKNSTPAERGATWLRRARAVGWRSFTGVSSARGAGAQRAGVTARARWGTRAQRSQMAHGRPRPTGEGRAS